VGCQQTGLPMCPKWRNVKAVSTLEAIVEKLKALPPEKLEQAADYVRRLKEMSEADRSEALEKTAGTLTKEEADAWEQAINEDCERIDDPEW